MLKGKKIILGISGSIAAYKAAMLTRLLVKAGAQVKVVMTEAATTFITPLTLATLSKNPVLTSFVKAEEGRWNNHVELGLWADAMVVAPASAKTMAAMVQGYADNLLTATYLSARCPVFVAPAMDLDMYTHPSTTHNLDKLKQYGNHIIEAETGELASGLSGQGRMAEPENIVQWLEGYFGPDTSLAKYNVLITAGPTHEKIDPVRFIGNHSSGKMGFALAKTMAKMGAKVQLVTGPAAHPPVHPNITVTKVQSAQEMYQASMQLYPQANITVLAAAVADYTPAQKHDQKLKKKSDTLTIELVKTKDIAASLGKMKQPGQFTVGFALETENELQNATSKLQNKNFDLIVLNSLNDKGAGFGTNTNKVTIINKKLEAQVHDLKDKQQVAEDIVAAMLNNIETP